MHRLFSLFFLAGVAGACIQLLMGDMEAPGRLVNALWAAADLAVEVSLGLIGVLALWSGLFRLAEASRLADRLSAWLTPLLGKLMPGLQNNRAATAPVTAPVRTSPLPAVARRSSPWSISTTSPPGSATTVVGPFNRTTAPNCRARERAVSMRSSPGAAP